MLKDSNMICLSHAKFWFKNKSRLSAVIQSKGIQDSLAQLLQRSSNELVEEFNCLLESSRKLYTL